ncbi:unnamed protein product [Prorocentrum cordatum]|uniref:Light harvesting protein n=1 Tax=Prorocentrum cordatum TaxID=2364126 RepID=A0ABN9VWS8_9DINO|nr:unnamed protein product [Polarella glacialis]
MGRLGALHWIPAARVRERAGRAGPSGFWDPAGFTADGSTVNFARRRQTELKHGRVSMLATMGYITPEITGKLPGYLSPSAGLKFADIPNGLGAISRFPRRAGRRSWRTARSASCPRTSPLAPLPRRATSASRC